MRKLAVLILMTTLSQTIGTSPLSHLSLSQSNDWATLGFGQNADDNRTFGGKVEGGTDRWSLSVSSQSYTDKTVSKARYDTAYVFGSVSFPFAFKGDTTFSLRPESGVVLVGNLGLATLQNAYHDKIGRERLDLPYEDDAVRPYPFFGLAATLSQTLGIFLLDLVGTKSTTPGWEREASVAVEIGIENFASFSFGYRQLVAEETKNAPHGLMVERYGGPFLVHRFSGGPVSFTWNHALQSELSSGSFGIDFMRLSGPKTFRHTDITYLLSRFYDLTGQQNRGLGLVYRNLLLETWYKNGPMHNAQNDPHRRMTIASWTVGYRKLWEHSGAVLPNLSVSGGIKRYSLVDDGQSRIETIRPVLTVQAGIDFRTGQAFLFGANRYRPGLACMVQYTFATASLHTDDTAFAKHLGPWTCMLGWRLSIDHDTDPLTALGQPTYGRI